MKKRILLILIGILLLCGCTESKKPVQMIQPISMYYRTAQTDYSAEDGVIRAEVRDLGPGSYTDKEVYERYFNGPESKDLVAPFSQDIKLSDVARSGNRLDVYLTQKGNSLSEFDQTLLNICLVKTGLEIEGVERVRIYVNSTGGVNKEGSDFRENSFLLYDDDVALNTIEIKLYYSDEEGRFLLPEKRTISRMSDEELVSYVLKMLLSEPQSSGMQSPLPPGTSFMDNVSVENGICTVMFYHEFCDNAPKEERAQELAVMSVVNTLCELETVNQVQILVPDRELGLNSEGSFRYLDLSYPWSSDSSVVGPVREELGEFEAALSLPGQIDNYLHRITVRARAKGGISREEALIRMLAARTAQNGLSIPFTNSASILSVSTKNGVCTVELGSGSLPAEERERSLSIRSIVATLTDLPEIGLVIVSENGVAVTDEPYTPMDEWFWEPNESE